MRLSTSIFAAAFISACAGPSSGPPEDPHTLQPALQHTTDAGPDCSVEVFKSELIEAEQLERFQYDPESCPGRWGQIVLRLRGNTAAAIQNARVGGLWINGVELLRFTTPLSATEDELSWVVDKDVTEYGPAFKESGYVAIQIGKQHSLLYPQLLYIDVSFDFYDKQMAIRDYRHVVPLVDLFGENSPINTMCVTGDNPRVSGPFTLPAKNIQHMWVDLVASGHECEEFWYMNLPTDDPDATCGGGAYRELRVFIDGSIAGIAYPFPVVYTDGLNPLLWRPLAGIESFDIEAYRFDVSPFLPLLNNGKPHEFAVDVVGNSKNGQWCLDPILVMEESQVNSEYKPVSFSSSIAADPVVKTGPASTLVNDAFEIVTTGTHEFWAQGSMRGDVDGELVQHRVSIQLDASNSNQRAGDAKYTSGNMNQHVLSTVGPSYAVESSAAKNTQFPYSVYQNTIDDGSTRQVEATVSLARRQNVELTAKNDAIFKAVWSNVMDAGAVYNVSESDSKINLQTNSANGMFKIETSGSLCYDRHAAVVNGHTITDSGTTNNCIWPEGLSFCGEGVCGIGRFYGGGALDVVAFV